MRFEQIGVHRNTDNSRDAQCYSNYQCKEPVTPLYKLGNSRLYDTFPEIIAFLFDFNILGEHLNNIVAHHQKHNNWLNATCQWLLNHEDVIKEWYQEIVRYDCSSFNGCGYSMNNDKNIGGYCSNSSIEPKCVCTDEALGGNDCRTHCPGLIGPIYNETNNSYFFQQCSNHGICDNTYWICTCDVGFGGDGCQIQYQQFNFYESNGNTSKSIFIIWMLLLFILSLIIIGSIIWLWMNQKYKSVKILGARMSTLFSIGLVLVCIGTMFFLIEPSEKSNYKIMCNLRIYFYGIGAVLSIMGPLLKAYRVNVIFNQARKVNTATKIKIPDTKLVLSLINAMVIEFIVCIVYSILSDQVSINYNNLYYTIEYSCNSNVISSNLLLSANFMYIFFLLLLLTFFAFKNRKIKSFVESKCSFFGSIISIALFIIVIIFYSTTKNRFVLLNIQCASIVIGISIIWCLFYGKTIYIFYKYPRKRMEFKMQSTFVHTNTKTKKTKSSPATPISADKNNKNQKIMNETENKDNVETVDKDIIESRDIADDLSAERRNSGHISAPSPEMFEADQYEYPENEKTIRYAENNELWVKHQKSVSLTPTANIPSFNILSGSKQKNYKKNSDMLQQVIAETATSTQHNKNEKENDKKEIKEIVIRYSNHDGGDDEKP